MTRPRIALAGVLPMAAIVVYAVMWLGYRQNWGWLHSVDWSLLNTAHGIAIKHPVWVQFWEVVCAVLGPIPMRLLGAVAVLVTVVMRKVRMALLLLACVPLNGFVTLAAKSLVDRPRPVTALVTAPSTSFPSGHALEATAGVLALLTFLLPMMNSGWMRLVAVTAGAVGVVTVGVGRVALNVHYPSDVMAGWALGYLYFLVCVWVFRPPPISGGELSPPMALRVRPEPGAGTAR